MRPRAIANHRTAAAPQCGMVLLMCLLFLMALTLLGLAASADAILQSKLAANLQEAERAKQSALLALSWAENWLLKLNGPALDVCQQPCSGLYLHAEEDLPSNPEFESFDWWMANGHEAGVDPITGERVATIAADSVNPPAWVIARARSISPAESGSPDLQVWYRILARGSGRTQTAVSVVESVIVRPWPAGAGSEPPSSGETSVCQGSETVTPCGRFAWRELL